MIDSCYLSSSSIKLDMTYLRRPRCETDAYIRTGYHVPLAECGVGLISLKIFGNYFENFHKLFGDLVTGSSHWPESFVLAIAFVLMIK